VAGSDIAVHREVFDDASVYFSPYSAQEMASVLSALLAPDAAQKREALRRRGAEVAERYTPDRVLPQWRAFLDRLAGLARSG
jgi:hypothetical protein